MFKVGDNIDYVFYPNVDIISEDENHFLLRTKSGSEKKIHKSLINKYGKMRENKKK